MDVAHQKNMVPPPVLSDSTENEQTKRDRNGKIQ